MMRDCIVQCSSLPIICICCVPRQSYCFLLLYLNDYTTRALWTNMAEAFEKFRKKIKNHGASCLSGPFAHEVQNLTLGGCLPFFFPFRKMNRCLGDQAFLAPSISPIVAKPLLPSRMSLVTKYERLFFYGQANLHRILKTKIEPRL